MYKFRLQISKLNEKVYTNFILHVTFISDFDVALNKQCRPRVSIMCMVVMQRFNVPGCQKTVSETKCYLSTTIERRTYLWTSTSAQRFGWLVD